MENLTDESIVHEKEIQMLDDMYMRMIPANRFFMVSAFGLILASQLSAEDETETGKVAV